MALSKQLVLVAALVVMFIGSAHAWKNGCDADVHGGDVNNCGGCKVKCYAPPHATAKCNKGKCGYSCQFGWGNCDKDWKNGCEKDLSKDVNNCGWGGNKCKQPKYHGGETVCRGGKCVEQCMKGMKWNDKMKCCV